MVRQIVMGTVASLALLGAGVALACTSLQYQDANGSVYLGRTLELQMELPYQTAFVPAGVPFSSQVDDHPAVEFTSDFAIIAITVPARAPSADAPLGLNDLKPVDGMNGAGLTFSLLAYPSVKGGQHQADRTQAVLSAVDLGTWALGQFRTVAEVKAALEDQPVILDPLAMLGGEEPPVHFVLHDRTGGSIVVEFDQGNLNVYDNPVGVMTNGPAFPWHLTNLDNYTFLNNVDQSSSTFGGLDVSQPDSGIATAGLPASNTSVGRFVRAAYYSQFAEKVDDPDAAVTTLAHVMNNFDRPRGITLDTRGGGEGDALATLDAGQGEYSSEYTSWTALADMDRTRYHIRTYADMNFKMLDLEALKSSADEVRVMSLASLAAAEGDATDALLAAKP